MGYGMKCDFLVSHVFRALVKHGAFFANGVCFSCVVAFPLGFLLLVGVAASYDDFPLAQIGTIVGNGLISKSALTNSSMSIFIWNR